MTNNNAINHARRAASNAAAARSLTNDSSQLTIAQAIYELSKAVEEIARRQS